MKPSGANGTKVSAPITINGAVSPIARLTAKITPVSILANAWGMTRMDTTCHFDAPSANPPSLMEDGTALRASWEAIITIGSIRSAIVSDPANTLRPRPAKRTNISSPNIP